MPRSLAISLVGFVLSCDPVLPQVQRPPPAFSFELVVDPEDRGAAVVRVALVGEAAAELAPADVWLVEGLVSDIALSRWASGDPPKTLLEHKVSTTSFAEHGALELIPHQPLALALEHSVIIRREEQQDGIALSFWTAESAPPHAIRKWPPADLEVDDEVVPFEVQRAYAMYCLEAATTFEDLGAGVALEPSGPSGRFSPFGDRCLIFEPDAQENAESGMFHPPRSWGGVDLDPSPIRIGAVAPTEVMPLTCAPEEVEMGPLCWLVQDDRVRFRADARAALYAVQAGGALALHAGNSEGESAFELRGLTPDTEIDITVRWFAADTTDQVLAQVRTTLPQPHLDIAEVMADPTGPEPEQEWIELHNDGLAPVELAGCVLSDAAGDVEITPFSLEAGGRVLLVREGFEDETLDPVRILVLPRLGGNGLSNEGEALELHDGLGAMLSTFPAAPKPKSGVSTSLVTDASGGRSWVHTDPTPLADIDLAR